MYECFGFLCVHGLCDDCGSALRSVHCRLPVLSSHRFGSLARLHDFFRLVVAENCWNLTGWRFKKKSCVILGNCHASCMLISYPEHFFICFGCSSSENQITIGKIFAGRCGFFEHSFSWRHVLYSHFLWHQTWYRWLRSKTPLHFHSAEGNMYPRQTHSYLPCFQFSKLITL